MTKKSGNANERGSRKPGRYEYRQKWSKMDLLALANCIRLNDPVEEIASFMYRSRRKIPEKIAELERSGELPGLIEKATAEAVDEPEDDNDTQGETVT
jgi:hypothetical protein